MELFKKIINDIKIKKISNIYFLMGDETYYIDIISDFIKKNVLNEFEKTFNQFIIYGMDSTIENIISYTKRYPLYSKYIIIIVKEAQELSENIENFFSYVKNPKKSTILVICYKYKFLDKRKKLYKILKKNGIIYESHKHFQYEIPEWINIYVKKKGYYITTKAQLLLSEYLGTNLYFIKNEIEKIIITLPKNGKITTDIIEKSVSINRIYTYSELEKAILEKNTLYVYKIIFFLIKNQNIYITYIINILFSIFRKLIIYYIDNSSEKQEISKYLIKYYNIGIQNYSLNKIKNIISYLRKEEIKYKGIELYYLNDKEKLKELFFFIFN